LGFTIRLGNGIYNLEKPIIKLDGDLATVQIGWTLKGKIKAV